MTSRDLLFLIVGTILAAVGVIATVLGNEPISLTALFMLGLLVLFLLILQRRHQSRVQERILYLVNAERKRIKAVSHKPAQTSETETNAILAKKVIGLLQAQQISMERLRREINENAD